MSKFKNTFQVNKANTYIHTKTRLIIDSFCTPFLQNHSNLSNGPRIIQKIADDIF